MHETSSPTAVAVVIVTHGSASMIGGCIEHLLAAAGPAVPVTVVDNASVDGTPEVVARYEPRVRLVGLTTNIGFGAACNRGVAESPSARWYVFINPDVTVESFDSQALLSEAERAPRVGQLAFACADGHAAGGSSTLRRGTGAAWGVLTRSWGALRPASTRRLTIPWRVRKPWGLIWASGALMGVSEAAWRVTGGFDEAYFLYYEDVDLSRRIVSSGFGLGVSSAIAGSHVGGASSPGVESPLRAAWAVSGWLTYIRRWHGGTPARVSLLALESQLALLVHLLALAEPSSGGGRLARKRREIEFVLHEVRRGRKGWTRSGSASRRPGDVIRRSVAGILPGVGRQAGRGR